LSKVLLIRHCEANGLREPDDDLTELGLEQAKTLATHLTQFSIDRVISSPYRRALRTIAPFIEASGLALELDQRIAERALSPDPFPIRDEWLGFVRRTFEDFEFSHPEGESSGAALKRGWAAVAEALADQNQMTALVSHGQFSSILLTSIDAAFGFEGWRAMTNPDVFLIEEKGRVVRFSRVWP
jgi:2,3-bisphosphoglycerate-dependent phosphoglycerate mutase